MPINVRGYIESKKNIYIIIWVLFGLVSSFVVCSMMLSGSLNINRFYDVGEVYEIRDNIFRTSIVQEGGHQEKTGEVVLDNGYFIYQIPMESNKNCWRYLCIKLRNTDGIQWSINYLKELNGDVIESEEYSYTLHSGMNLLDIPQDSFYSIQITATGDVGESFIVSSMQLRENAPVFTVKKACSIFILSFLLYVIIFGFLKYVCHKMGIKINIDLYHSLDILQNIYLVFIQQLQKAISCNPQKKIYIGYCRTSMFVMIFLYSMWVEMQDTYLTDYLYHVLIYFLFIMIIIVLSIEAKPTKKNWNNSLVCSWLILWIMAALSDFLIPKDFRFVSCMMVFVIGFFAFIWNNMQNPEEMTHDFVRAIHIFFIFILIFCLLCRPEIDGRRYSGISKNPGVFGLYLGTIWAVLLSEIETRIYEEHCLKKILPYILELCLVFSFCWKSQSATSLLCMFGLGVVFFLKLVCSVSKKKKYLLMTVILFAAILYIPAYEGLSWGLKNIPQFTGISIVFENEEPIAKEEYGLVVYAKDFEEELKNSRIVQKFSGTSVSQMLSGRNYYYKTYLRNMNLFGHNENPEIWGVARLPHNALLAISYRYGIFSFIPYILMLATVLIRTFRYSIAKRKYASAPFFVCLSSIAMSILDNVEFPFFWLPWFGLYLLMGIAFDDDIINGSGENTNENETNRIY